MKDKVFAPAQDVPPTKSKSLPLKSRTNLISTGESEIKGIDPSELFSHFTANIINEKKVITR